MAAVRLTPPDPVDLVPAENVRAIIAATDRELAELEREAAAAGGAADLAEARAHQAGVDGRAAMWAMVRMQRFFDGLRNEVEQEVQLIGDLARRRARIRVDEAHAEAARIRGGLPPPVEDAWAAASQLPEWEPPAATAPPVAEVPPVLAVTRAAAEVPAVNVPAPAEAPAPARPEPPPPPAAVVPVTAWSPPATPEPSPPEADVPTAVPIAAVPVGPNVAEMPVDEPDASPNSSPDGRHTTPPAALAIVPGPTIEEAAHETAPIPAVSVPTATAPIAAVWTNDDALDETSMQAPAGDFWTEQPTKPRRGLLRRVPLSAVLEVLAVLLILVFILLRLS